jgi:hypothetical protein
MIDLTTETPLPLAAAAKFVPPGRNGKRTHLSTLLRWILRGAKSPTGEIVHLEALRLGGRWVTSREAIQRFALKLTPQIGKESNQVPRTPASRQGASERAARQLERLGI